VGIFQEREGQHIAYQPFGKAQAAGADESNFGHGISLFQLKIGGAQAPALILTGNS
jgi:hypothetical protein